MTATFTPINVVMISLLSMLIKNEEKSLLKFIGVIVSVVGAIGLILIPMMLNGGQIPFDTNNMIGIGLLSINTINFAINANLQTALMTWFDIPPLTVTAWMNMWNMIFTCVMIPFFWNQCNFSEASWDTYYGVIYAGTIGASIPWTINNFVTKKLKPTTVTIYSTTQPIFVAIFSYLVLEEIIQWYTAVGAIVILSGVLCVAAAKYLENTRSILNEQEGQQKYDERSDGTIIDIGGDVEDSSQKEGTDIELPEMNSLSRKERKIEY